MARSTCNQQITCRYAATRIWAEYGCTSGLCLCIHRFVELVTNMHSFTFFIPNFEQSSWEIIRIKQLLNINKRSFPSNKVLQWSCPVCRNTHTHTHTHMNALFDTSISYIVIFRRSCVHRWPSIPAAQTRIKNRDVASNTGDRYTTCWQIQAGNGIVQWQVKYKIISSR